MKSFFTFLFLALLSISSVNAQDIQRPGYAQTKFSISSLSKSVMTIVIDGNNYTYDNSRGDADFILNTLSAGNHMVKIMKQQRTRRAYGNTNSGQVLYESNVYLRAQYHTDLFINRFNRIFKDEMQLTGQPQVLGSPGYPSQYNQPMSTASFSALKSTLSNEAFDNSRLNIAKQAAAANYFSAAQVKELMMLFSYDASRLDIAKTLYPRTTDKGNYFIVNDAFTYSDSKDQLAAFIRDNP